MLFFCFDIFPIKTGWGGTCDLAGYTLVFVIDAIAITKEWGKVFPNLDSMLGQKKPVYISQ